MRLDLKTLALSLAAVGLAGSALHCSKSEEKQESSAKKGDGGSGDAGDDDPFARHEGTFDKLSDIKIVPKETLPATSGGSGGDTGKVSGTFKSKVGLSAKYVLHVPDGASDGALKLYAYFHGDGGGSAEGMYESVKTVAEERGVIGIAMEAPNGASWWSGQGLSQARHFEEFVQELYGKYDVDTSKLYLAGSSGGANFIAGIVMPLYSYKYPMRAVLLCGGTDNLLEDYKWVDGLESKTEVFVHTAEEDMLIEQIRRSIAYFKERGVPVEETYEPGSAHCGFDTTTSVLERLAK